MKVSIITLPFRKTHLIKPVYDAIFAQTHQDIEVLAVLNDPTDGSKEILQRDYPTVKIIEPGANLFFAKGMNLAIRNTTGEFVQMVTDDFIMAPDYVEKLLAAFLSNPKVAAASGKILRYDFKQNQKTNIIDTVGLVLDNTGRVRDIGQLQTDMGQYDRNAVVFGVSGAGPMYRKSALEKVKFEQEYFDEDFVMYWEDVDLSWRLNNAGYVCTYVGKAVAFHGRTAGQSEGGYLHIIKFIRHHKKLSPQILKWNYKNHILMYIKNARHIFHPAFILREIAMFGYILVFETDTLKVLPELFRQIPKILKKRKFQSQ